MDSALGCSGVIVSLTAAYLVAGLAALAAWRVSSNVAWVEQFFQVPAAVAMLWLASMQLWLAAQTAHRFTPGEMLRKAWVWMTLSAACDFAGTIATQILAIKSRLNPLMLNPQW